MGNNFFTPDRETNPPEDDRFCDCPDCDGSGKIQEEDGETYTCLLCKGEGQVEKNTDNEEW